MKKLIAIAMALTIGLAAFTGCTKKTDDNTTKPDDNTNQVEAGDDTTKPDDNDTEENTTDEDTTQKDAKDEDESEDNKPQAKVAVNISGTIEEINEDGDKIKVDGKWVIITEDTRFEDDPDNGVETVSKEFKVGNTIAGWTSGDAEAEEVTADVIYSNK